MTHPLIPLRRVFRVVNGGTPTPHEVNWGGSVPWATPVDLGAAGRTVGVTQRTLTEIGARDGSTIVPSGSILVSTRAPIGYVAIADRDMAFNQGCKALVATSEVDPRFFAYQLNSRVADLQAAGQGSTFMELPNEGLASLRVTIPPMQEQRRIADFLDDQVALFDRAIGLRKRQEQLLAEETASLLACMFDPERPGMRPARLKHLLAQPPCYGVLVPDFSEGEVPFIRVSDLGRVDRGEKPTLSIATAQSVEYRRTVVAAGDVLTSVVGTLGASAIVSPDNAGANVARAVCRLQPAAGVPSWLLRGWLASPQFLAAAQKSTGTGTAQATLNMGDLSKFVLGVPSDARGMVGIGKAACDVLSSQKKNRELIWQSKALLQERKQALITAAVTGQLDVTTARSVA